jgi:hypothetical protein
MKDLIVILICSAAALGCAALGVGLFVVSPPSHVYSKAKRHIGTKTQKTSNLTPA